MPKQKDLLDRRHFVDDGTETPDSLEAQFAFPDLNYSFRLQPSPKPGFEHTDATLVTTYGNPEASRLLRTSFRHPWIL